MIEIGALWHATANSMSEEEKNAMKATDKPVSVGMDLASGPDRTAWASVRLPDNLPRMRPGAVLIPVHGDVLLGALTAKAAGMPTYYDTIPTSGKTMHSALLRILGDMPRPDEDPYERCRAIASAALGYQKPDPMSLPGQSMRKCGLYSYEDAAGQIWRRMEDSVENDAHDMCVDSLCRERDAAIAVKDDEIALLRQALAAKDARIGELKSVLACTPVAFEDPDAKPVPVPGFLAAIRRGNKAVIGMVTGRGDMPSPIT